MLASSLLVPTMMAALVTSLVAPAILAPLTVLYTSIILALIDLPLG